MEARYENCGSHYRFLRTDVEIQSWKAEADLKVGRYV